MNAASQHAIHPGAEQLSAFAEQALAKGERAQVLAHLAVCGRCRQVVALAGEAEAAEQSVSQTQPEKSVLPFAWWHRWRLVWVPAAVAAALVMASISAGIYQARQHGSAIQIARQTPPAEATPAATPQEPASSPAPAAAAPEEKRVPGAPPAEAGKGRGLAAPAPVELQYQSASSSEGDEAHTASGGEADKILRMPDAPAPAQAAPSPVPASSTASQDRQQAELAAAQERSYAARMKQTDSFHGVAGIGQAENQTVNVVAPAPAAEMQVVPVTNPVSAKKSKTSRAQARAAQTLRLPGGLPPVSLALSGERMLAVDKAGTLYLSLDLGSAWEPVACQWTGQIVLVRWRNDDAGKTAAAPSAGTAAQSESTPPTGLFEIRNDRSQAWVSPDGKTWTAQEK